MLGRATLFLVKARAGPLVDVAGPIRTGGHTIHIVSFENCVDA